jgi:uncharacterized protein YecE (DUF72 family)
MTGQLIVGTSGFSYQHWKGRFYPTGTPQSRWLEYYSSVFSAIELNVTFYRQPSAEQFRTWRERVPDGFRFVVKGSRYITHYRRLLETTEQLERFFTAASGLGSALDCVLWQLPPGMDADVGRLEEFAAQLPRFNAGDERLRHAFEFRDESWFAEPVYEVLRRANAALVMTDPSVLGRTEAARTPPTAGFTYIRLHGTDHDHGGYLDGDLDPWVERARTDLNAGRDVYAFFNNDPWGMAPRDAARLEEILGGSAR